MSRFAIAFAGATAVLGLAIQANADPYAEAKAAHARGDYAAYMSIVRPLAEKGEARAQDDLAWLYHDGMGVPQDYGKALFWYAKAAGQDDATAEANLGLMYARGEGVAKDGAQAERWYRKAASQGDIEAAFALAASAVPNDQATPSEIAAQAGRYRAAGDAGDLLS